MWSCWPSSTSYWSITTLRPIPSTLTRLHHGNESTHTRDGRQFFRMLKDFLRQRWTHCWFPNDEAANCRNPDYHYHSGEMGCHYVQANRHQLHKSCMPHHCRWDPFATWEGIIARTICRVEQTNEYVQLVGLSATLPNYQDVASFLCVDEKKELFYFDASYHPCALQQQFIGVTEKRPSRITRSLMRSAMKMSLIRQARTKLWCLCIHGRRLQKWQGTLGYGDREGDHHTVHQTW